MVLRGWRLRYEFLLGMVREPGRLLPDSLVKELQMVEAKRQGYAIERALVQANIDTWDNMGGNKGKRLKENRPESIRSLYEQVANLDCMLTSLETQIDVLSAVQNNLPKEFHDTFHDSGTSGHEPDSLEAIQTVVNGGDMVESRPSPHSSPDGDADEGGGGAGGGVGIRPEDAAILLHLERCGHRQTRRTLHDLKEKYETLQHQLSQRSIKLDEINVRTVGSDLESLQIEQETVLNSLESLNSIASSDRLVDELKLREMTISQLRSRVLHLEKDRLDKVPFDAAKEITRLNNNLVQLEKARDELSIQNFTLKSKLSDVTAKINDPAATYQVNRDSLNLKENSVIQNGKTESVQLKDADDPDVVKVLRKATYKVTNDSLKLRQMCTEFNNKEEEYKKRITDLETEMKNLQNESTRQHDRAIREMENRLEMTSQRLEAAERYLTAKEEEYSMLKLDFDTLNEENKRLKENLNDLILKKKEYEDMASQKMGLEQQHKRLVEENRVLAEDFNRERVLRKKYYNQAFKNFELPRKVFKISEHWRKAFKISEYLRMKFKISEHLRKAFKISEHLRKAFKISEHLRKAKAFKISEHLRRAFKISKHLRKAFKIFEHMREAFKISEHLRKAFNISEYLRKAVKISEHLRKAFNISEYLRQAFKISEHLRKAFKILEHMRKAFKISEHLRKAFKISEHLRIAFKIFEHLRKAFNISEYLRQAFKISEHLRKAFKILEHMRKAFKISEHLRKAFKISEHLRKAFKISEHLRKAFKLSKHLRMAFKISKHQRKAFKIFEHMREAFKISERLRKAFKISKHLKKAFKISEYLRMTFKISKHLRKSFKIFEHMNKEAFKISLHLRKVFKISDHLRKAFMISEHPWKAFKISDHLRKAFKLSERLRKAFKFSKHLKKAFKTSEHLRKASNIFEHMRKKKAFNIFEHLRKAFKVSEHLRKAFKISELLRNAFKLSEHFRRAFKISEYLRKAFKISKHLRWAFNISEHLKKAFKISEHLKEFKIFEFMRKAFKTSVGSLTVLAHHAPQTGADVTSCESDQVDISRCRPHLQPGNTLDHTRDLEDTLHIYGIIIALIQSALDGFNVTIMAYGQTGSGKTYTMLGTESNPGIAPRAFQRLFQLVNSNRARYNVHVSTYMMELYNDKLIDLLKPVTSVESDRLEIKRDKKGSVHVQGATVRNVSSANDLTRAFEEGLTNRHTASTNMNVESSRSHLLIVICLNVISKQTGSVLKGKLTLVDLAGSERINKSGALADQLREANSINKSLSALGDVISALSSESSFVPYRNSKLTMLLQDSLGGNAKTLVFVNVSPAAYNVDETLISLMYASRIKQITNSVSKNSDNKEISRLKSVSSLDISYFSVSV
ncbi:uncharacterized protein [Panulirus ornatus]|uniref:uncharacterized protein n=1 Tax=Panulirus ornatus TaxID=150431 RepID=UPI003A8BA056